MDLYTVREEEEEVLAKASMELLHEFESAASEVCDNEWNMVKSKNGNKTSYSNKLVSVTYTYLAVVIVGVAK